MYPRKMNVNMASCMRTSVIVVLVSVVVIIISAYVYTQWDAVGRLICIINTVCSSVLIVVHPLWVLCDMEIKDVNWGDKLYLKYKGRAVNIDLVREGAGYRQGVSQYERGSKGFISYEDGAVINPVTKVRLALGVRMLLDSAELLCKDVH